MKLSWCDTTTFKPRISKTGRDYLDSALGTKDGKVFLEMKTRATHSGHLITGRCYTGWGMKAGCPTWFDTARGGKAGFDKPMIVDHDLASPPLGRIVFADFTQLKTGSEWTDDWRNPESGPNRMGSGYIMTTGHLFDAEAIQMVADHRYSTVSTRQNADNAWCSVCGEQFSDGCEHEIGKMYDGLLCYAVTGMLDYVEQSFVNSPRQPNAKVISFKEMRDALADKNDKGTLLVGDCVYDGEVISDMYLRTMKDYEVTIDLSKDSMPSSSVITGRTQVSMSASKPVELKGFKEIREKVEPTPVTSADTAAVPAAEQKAPESFDFVFANLARFWKDSLDLNTTFADDMYVLGITDKTSGHAHIIDGFMDTKNKVFRGVAYGAGQGKTQMPHRHDIWIDTVDLNEGMVKGTTRSASAGADHNHTFSTSMSDSSELHGTLISSVDEVKKAIQTLDERVNKDTLALSDKEKLLSDSNTEISWDATHVAAAMRLMGRLSPEKRHTVAEQIAKQKFDSNEDPSMDKTTLDKLIESLLADKQKLTSQLADAVQLSDAKENERQKLLDENISLKTAVITLKATLLVDARAILASDSNKLDDAARKAAIVELATKDESMLDSMLKEEVLGNIRKVTPAAPVVEPKSKEVTAGAPLAAVSDSSSNAKPGTTERPRTKSFASLDSRVSEKKSAS